MIRDRHWEAYCSNFEQLDPRLKAFEQTAENFYESVIRKFDHQSRSNGLLFGEVQSGKTSHTFALIAATADADEGFRTFVYFSTDNVPLQEQTLKRGFQDLSETFEVINEGDELRFSSIRDSKPCLIVLKKNVRVLQKWIEILENSRRVSTGPIFLIDDEGDAASPNTKTNKSDESEIYKKIQAFRGLGTSSVLLQVTATPQSLFLQQEIDGLRPNFTQYFEPGLNYLGGDFYFSKIDSARNVFIDENDLEISLQSSDFSQASGLFRAFSSFFVTCAYFRKYSKTNANALFHPSVNTGKHHDLAVLARRYFSWLSNYSEPGVHLVLRSALDDLKRTLEVAFSWDDLVEAIRKGIDVRVIEMNSTQHADRDADLSEGFNAIVGGNTLGRGVTFPHLQTVYYTRQSKTPQADTYWQHARMFGYDRDKTALRIFMPLELFVLFNNLQESNAKLASVVKSGELKNLQIILPSGIKPTRSNVIRRDAYALLVGGTNMFPASPDQLNACLLDSLLSDFNENEVYEIGVDLAKKLVSAASVEREWPSNRLNRAIGEITQSGVGVKLLVGRKRNIGRTGTMLAENDRQLGNQLGNDFVITAYRVIGQKEKLWQGSPFWMINVRLPDGFVYHQVN